MANLILQQYKPDKLAALKDKPEAFEDWILAEYDIFFKLSKNITLIDPLGYYKFDIEKGFYFSIDSVYNVFDAGIIVSALVVITENQVHEPIIFCDIDWAGSRRCISYKDGPQFIDVNQVLKLAQENLNEEGNNDEVRMTINCVVCLFKITYKHENLNVDQLGFGVVPLTLDEGFLHGVYQIPIFNEPISYKFFNYMKKMDGWNMIKRRWEYN